MDNTNFLKIVYFDEAFVADFMQIIAGGELKKTTEFITEVNSGIEGTAGIEGGVGTEKNALSKIFTFLSGATINAEASVNTNVILLDEFDKVSPSFYNAFYQMFDEGTFVDANYSVDVSKCIIICTTNYRTEEEAEKYLGTPIYSRFSKVVIFNPISVDDKLKIARKCYAGLMAQVDAEDKALIENNSVLSLFERVIKEGAYPNMRMLRNDIEDAINFEILKARGIIQ